MKKIMNWMTAAILICSVSVFAACSSDDDDAPNKSQTEAEKNRDIFIEHTRAVVKDLAENLNFTSWETANYYNLNFNQYVLLNDEFENTVLGAFMTEVINSLKPVEEGSELANMGFENYVTVDLTNFNYRFTMNDDNTSFDVKPAGDFEILLNGYNPKTKTLEKGLYKLLLRTGGTTMTRVLPMPKMDGVAMVMVMGSEFQFALSNKINGSWNDDFTGIMHYQVPEGATDGSKGFTADAVINSNILAGTVGEKADKSTLEISINSDRVNGHANGQVNWTQNGRKMMELSVKESGNDMGGISDLDLSKFDSTSSIFEVIGSILSTRSIDEAKLTLLDDLTFTFSISNIQKLLEIEAEYRTEGRQYADKETIDQYTQKMNELVKAQISCKATNQTLPMRLATAPVGIDYWSIYEIQFSEQEYLSLLTVLDRKTFAYLLNIMDHSADHMQQGVIVVRQLMELMLKLNNMLGDFTSSQK